MKQSRKLAETGKLSTIILLFGACLCMAAGSSAASGGRGVQDKVSWTEFLSAADPVWERLPGNWWEAPYLGNGMMGTLIRKLDGRTVEWQVGRSDVEDYRPINYGMGRLPIGSFLLHTQGELTDCDMRLDLLNAEAGGAIHTGVGKVAFRTLVHADHMVILVLWKGEGGEAGSVMTWSPKEALHPRLAVKPDPERKKTWSPNPEGHQTELDGTPVWVQPLSEGGYATAWHECGQDGWRALCEWRRTPRWRPSSKATGPHGTATTGRASSPCRIPTGRAFTGTKSTSCAPRRGRTAWFSGFKAPGTSRRHGRGSGGISTCS